MLKIPVALRGQQDRAGPGLGSSHQCPDWHYGTACPILSPQGRGWGLITPSPTPPGASSRVLQLTETSLVSALSLCLFLPSLLCSQHSLRLNFWPQNPHSGSKQEGTPWNSHGGGVWQCPGPGTGNLAPSQDVCMGVLGQKLMAGKQTQTHFPASINGPCQASPRCGSPLTPAWGTVEVQGSSAFLVYPQLLSLANGGS